MPASAAICWRSSAVARLAAYSAIAGSITWRTSNSWLTSALRSSPVKFMSGSASATTERLPRRTMYPAMTSPWIASRTEVRATPNSSHRTRSAGSGMPGAN